MPALFLREERSVCEMSWIDNSYGTYDTLESLSQSASKKTDSFDDNLQTNQQMYDAQMEWLSREPGENLEMLNAESNQTGVYAFSYVESNTTLPNIPGMNQVSFEVPGEGGRYVGYESFEQTFAKAQQEYNESSRNGTMSLEKEEQFLAASEQYQSQKMAYATYLEQNPSAPDYLHENGNPVEKFSAYDAKKTYADNLLKKETEEAATDIAMSDVEKTMDSGYVGTMSVKTAAESGEYAKAYQKEHGPVEAGQEYMVRVTESVDKETILGMNQYTSQMGAKIPEVTAKEGTDEYGQQMVERIKAIDTDLAAMNPEYQSSFPKNMQYYPDGANPRAIPGMTVVVGEIEGAPGYFVGYESYDTTYQHTLSGLDKAASELQGQGLSEQELLQKQEELNTGYQQANQTYDTQKSQYESYVSENPANDFLDKDNPLESYMKYNESNDFQQGGANVIANVKEFIKDMWKKVKNWWDELSPKPVGALSEEEALQMSSDYWSKRATLESDNSEMMDRATEVNKEYQQVKLSNELERQRDVPYSDNPFRAIVDNSQTYQENYYPQNQMNPQNREMAKASTGSSVLDELSVGSTDSVDAMVMHMPDTGQALYDPSLYDVQAIEKESEKQMQQQAEQQRTRTAEPAKSNRLQDAMAMEDLLQKNGAEAQMDTGFSFGK